MQTIYKGTTPSLILNFDTTLDLREASSIVVTFATDYHKILFEKTKADLVVGEHSLTVSFTQRQTLALKSGGMLIQMNALYGPYRVCSGVARLQWLENLKDEVMQ